MALERKWSHERRTGGWHTLYSLMENHSSRELDWSLLSMRCIDWCLPRRGGRLPVGTYCTLKVSSWLFYVVVITMIFRCRNLL